jgi:hypothetical protein
MNKRDNIIKWTIVGIFVGLYAMVSIISTIHVIDFFRLSNPNWLAVTLAIAFEVGAAASLGAIVILDKTSRFMVWMLFLIITGMQMMGNMYYAYTHLTEFQSWSELFGLIEEEPIYQKRILSLISGAILPLVALGFIKSLVDYIRPTKVEDTKTEFEKSSNDIPIEENVESMRKVVDSYDTLQEEIKDWDNTLMDGLEKEPEVKEPMLADLFSKDETHAYAKQEALLDETPTEEIQTEENPHNITIESVDNKEEWPPKEEIQFHESQNLQKAKTINSIEELREVNKMHA